MYYYFNYEIGDWVKKFGLPQHHLRITDRLVDEGDGQRWYKIFDTTLNRGHADYEWVLADQLEASSVLVAHAVNSVHVQQILWRCQNFCCLPYSIRQRQDCESVQRFIHTGRENDRWSPQVWTGIAAAIVGVVAIARSK